MTHLEAGISIVAGIVIILGAVLALVRSILKLRDTFRDNISATQANTKAIKDLIENQVSILERRISVIERKMGR